MKVNSTNAVSPDIVRVLIELADAGNIDAGDRLLRLASSALSRDGQLPAALASWLAARLDGARQHPDQAGQELRLVRRKGVSSIASRLPVEAANWFRLARKSYAAWRIFELHRDGVPLTSLNDAVETAPKIVAKELEEGPYADELHPNERRVEPKTVLNWFYMWKPIIDEAIRHQPIMVAGAPLSVFSGDR